MPFISFERNKLKWNQSKLFASAEHKQQQSLDNIDNNNINTSFGICQVVEKAFHRIWHLPHSSTAAHAIAVECT